MNFTPRGLYNDIGRLWALSRRALLALPPEEAHVPLDGCTFDGDVEVAVRSTLELKWDELQPAIGGEPVVLAIDQLRDVWGNPVGCSIRSAFEVRADIMPIDGYKSMYRIVEVGAGEVVVKGSAVVLHAEGFCDDQEPPKKFWSTKDPGQQPFRYEAGTGAVLRGFDAGVIGMRQGEVREIIIPGNEAYATRGSARWGIKPHAPLRFIITCLETVYEPA